MAVPSATWQMLEQRTSGEPLPKGLDAVWNAGVGFVDGFVPRYRGFIRRVEKILSLEKHFSEMTDSKLRDVASELCGIFRCHRDNSSDLERAFALIREVAFRQIGEKPFPVQVAVLWLLRVDVLQKWLPERARLSPPRCL